MRHTVAVIGAGYAGFPLAKRLARQTHRDEVDIVMVNASPWFLERPRLHQLATGQAVRKILPAHPVTGCHVPPDGISLARLTGSELPYVTEPASPKYARITCASPMA